MCLTFVTDVSLHVLATTRCTCSAASEHIKWDEDNLIYNETHKTATMKIDEAKTPYNFSPIASGSHI
jgi:DNA helicase IV